MGWLDFGLGIEGCPEDLIQQIDTAEPILEDKLMPVLKKLEAVWIKSQPASAHIAQTKAIIVAAMPDIEAVAPTVAAAISFTLTKI